MKFKSEKLIIWQKAMKLGEDIDVLADNFPQKEIFNITSQIRRAADSIALNISEQEFNTYYESSFELMNRMIAFRNKII